MIQLRALLNARLMFALFNKANRNICEITPGLVLDLWTCLQLCERIIVKHVLHGRQLDRVKPA